MQTCRADIAYRRTLGDRLYPFVQFGGTKNPALEWHKFQVLKTISLTGNIGILVLKDLFIMNHEWDYTASDQLTVVFTFTYSVFSQL